MPKISVEKIESLTGHKDCLYTVSHGSKDDTIFTSGGDGLIVEWDLNNPGLGKMIAKVNHSVYALAHSEVKNRVLIGQNFEGIHLVDLTTKEEIKSAKITESYIFDITETKAYIFCACGDGNLIILNSNDLSVVKKIQISDKSLRSLSIHLEKNHLAIGTSDHHIYILNLDDLGLIKKLASHTNSVFSVCYHPTLPYLLSTGRDARIKIWHTDGYNLHDEIVAHMYAINDLKFSPDSNYFASCSMDKSIKVWDASTFKLLKVIDQARHAGHGTSVNKLFWSNKPNRLISVSDDRTASIWSIQIDNS